MARNYDLDTKAATEAGSGGSRRVDHSGLYPATILFAWGTINDNGTEAVHIIADCDNGQKLEQAFYTFNKSGEALPSYKMVNALMTCASVRQLSAVRGDVTRYDFDAKADLTYKEDVYPELVGKRAIFAVQMEAYVNGQGQERQRPIVVGVYHAENRRSAAEILAKPPGEAKSIDAQGKWLEANPVKAAKEQRKPQGTPPIAGSGTPPIGGASFDDDDSGIPF
jgi:hypothetical protein